ncbi:ATP-dependent Clp protease adapter ClpS [Galbitalea soli]|uniref:ATP-dependent Clp protease adapter protein ClpS n=1 Tax=Galbitalea soli TaxID=1268042 RepID=A0A7C9PNG6_9MICO|nr:ATP-dependent Clp protease adapter ClpS [Galbitalea soli]
MSRVRVPSFTPEDWLGFGRANSSLGRGPRGDRRAKTGADRGAGGGDVAQTLDRTDAEQGTALLEEVRLDTPWVTVVWNDPVNLMSYVSYVFRSYFGFSRAEAERRMLLVHNEGRAVVAAGPREEMERHVAAMHDYGLWATVQKDDS